MIITPEMIRTFHRKNIYFRSIVPHDRMSNRTLIAVDRYNAPMKIKNIGPTIIQCKVPQIGEMELEELIKLKLSNLGRKWLLMSLFGEDPSNIGREICFKCGCKTEHKRDFLTFAIRPICPHCHI